MSDPKQEESTAALEEASTVISPRPSPAPAAGEPLAGPLPPASGPGGAHVAPGRTLAGRYTVLDVLGQGGMGRVLAAYDARLDRRVALKLVHSREDGRSSDGMAQIRMVREAQSMARLNHPHVVAVYDAGTLEDGAVFIAMEYVQGQTLRQWCQQAPSRPWREVVHAYLAAGRGLVAAHAAGLIHRDFKPDNVLIGEDGRVRVTDFGLARAGSTPDAAQPVTALPTSALHTPLTLPGSVLGTPAYMAPELLQGQPANVRSDVYAFCASLYEALYGRVPFALDSLASLLRLVHEGKPPVPPADSQVPAWVSRAVLQGLHPDPLQRPDSLEQVLRQLEDDPEARRRTRLQMGGLAASVALLAGLAVWAWGRSQGPGCESLERRLEGVWDAPVKARVAQALEATGLPYAKDTAQRVERLLEGYAQAWVKQRVEVCQAAGVQPAAAQPQSLALLREGCLERRRSQLQTLTGLLGRGPDPDLLNKAVPVVQALPPLEYCADAQALLAAVPPPEDPQVRARVEALQAQVEPLAVLLSAGKYPEGLALSEQLLPQVETVGHAPLHARTLLLKAQLQEGAGDYKGAEATARQAIAEAARGKDAVLAAQAWNLQLLLVGVRQARPKEAEQLEPLLETVVELAGDEATRADSLQVRGRLLESVGKFAEAQEHYERVLASREKLFGRSHLRVALALTDLGNVLRRLGHYADAKERLERALSIQQETVGSQHVTVAHALTTLGIVFKELGQYEEAQARHERSLSILEKALGPEHPNVSKVLASVGIALAGRGQYEEARLRFERARSIQEKTYGPEHPDVAGMLINLGGVLADLGRYEEAKARQERALAVLEKVLGPQHPVLSIPLTLLGRALTGLGRYDEAQRTLDRALALQAQPQEHPGLVEPLTGLGLLQLARGRPAAAVPLLERALRLAPEQAGTEVRFVLAQALWESKQDRPRALELATHAREEWRRRGHTSRTAEVSQWLAARR